MKETDFHLKGSVVTTVLLELHRFSSPSVINQISEKINQAPHFFSQAPLIIDVSKLEGEITLIELNTLVSQVTELGFRPIGWRSVGAGLPSWHDDFHLPMLPPSKTRSITPPIAETDKNPDVVVKTVVQERMVTQPTKVISKPIRSGQQVYSEGDLVILAQVGAGAEVLAEGNIHVYGALRGRALAGVNGDTSARIFCKSMEAELVSIAGNFMLSDALQEIIWKESAQVLLIEDNLEILAL
ncbi:septum site-determining protein MinC [Marinomonas sp. 15G1-11]|uniref:Probable septum site-determining protein MinC n=1 Tax=Marinomonas phaeophyticola TaxID=3004091 RepID=A0ABT4JYJ3_9GAMM|nr:septum site-determining protein MinC [Marinomonas sp. 15G1-11]MCZ2723474.1 septum site-determining protein MinC [Marinomonas sp. 15G1-11]